MESVIKTRNNAAKILEFKVELSSLNIERPAKAPADIHIISKGETMIRQTMPSPKNIALNTIVIIPFKIDLLISCLDEMFSFCQNHELIIPITNGIIINSENIKVPLGPSWFHVFIIQALNPMAVIEKALANK